MSLRKVTGKSTLILLRRGRFQFNLEVVIHKVLIQAVLFLLADAGAGVDYYSAADLQAKAKTMAANTKAVTHTAVVNPMAKYGNDYTLLVYRNADGLAELHEHESDLYLVVDGEATLISGGSMIDRRVKSEGEFTASGIQGGQSQVLRKGDVVHISPNLPHQLKVKPGQTFSYFVQKVKEQ